MPAKTRGGRKGKYAYRAKKQGPVSPSMTPVSPSAPTAASPASAPPRPAPRPASPSAAARTVSAVEHYPITTELRNIAILIAIGVVIMVVLSRVLA